MMTHQINELLGKRKVNSLQSIIAELMKNDRHFDFSNCEFKLGINLYEVIKLHPVDGIEILQEISADNTDLIDAKISPGLYITNLRFTKSVTLGDSVFNGPVKINNVIFEKDLQFSRAILNNRTEFIEVITNGNVFFSSLKAKGKFSLSNCKITLGKPGFKYSHFESDFFSYESDYPQGLDVSMCVFKGKFEFNCCRVPGFLDLSNSKFNRLIIAGALNGTRCSAINDFVFEDAEVNGQTQFYNLNIEGRLQGGRAIFNSHVYIDNVLFKGKSHFSGIKFNEQVNIDNCTVEKHLSFSYSTFNKRVSIKRTKFDTASIWFTGTKINDDFWFGEGLSDISTISISGTLSFQGTNVSSNSIVRIFGINEKGKPKGILHFHNAVIKGLVDIRNVHLTEANFDGTVVTGNVQDNCTLIPAVRDRHTARILKNEAKKINNQISALSYYRCEVSLYAKSIKFWNFNDYLLLKLNFWSNNYGTSWLRGILFIFFSGMIFFSGFTLTSKGVTVVSKLFSNPWQNSFWAGFINYVWLPSGLEGLITNNAINGGFFGALLFILGKILIAYGIYQTISAFRKFL